MHIQSFIHPFHNNEFRHTLIHRLPPLFLRLFQLVAKGPAWCGSSLCKFADIAINFLVDRPIRHGGYAFLAEHSIDTCTNHNKLELLSHDTIHPLPLAVTPLIS